MRDIVTGVRGAEAAVRVLERALAEAETTHRRLRVLTAWSTPPMVLDAAGLGYGSEYIAPSVSTSCAQELVDTLLDKALRERHSLLPVTTTTETDEGQPGRVLVEAGKDAGLIVVGGRGHGALASALLGSTTGFVLHHAHGPVMVVPDRAAPGPLHRVVVGGRGHGALASALLGSTTGFVLHHAHGPVMVVPDRAAPGPLHRVVVGYDGEECSRSALRWGLDAATRYRCPLHVVHAMNILPIPGPNVLYPDYDIATRSWLTQEVDEALEARHDVEVILEIIEGPAARVLISEAGADDLLVVGSRGRGGFADLVLGSVATQCTTHARGAVVVVRRNEERLDRPLPTVPPGARP
jgi:nucleotide-binding universal stress UspA family protein